ncbi:HAMP domain-containing sensor histidine kinase [Acidiferrobacter sp.]|jgi:signal transduction histidine kinase|uniref:hybrid sensor histidine kinase/response regulator n=2 Tax=Acidiferrobacter sp. TaxID=1872107 RepID=UPI00261B5AA3|nr:HAMP domain-containing sensor histidine kinase [Acidiferrobacter sp.]
MSDVVPEKSGDRNDTPRRRILVVDDDDGLRAGLAIGLKRDGYIVQLAGDAREAIEKLASMNFDLILLDLHLPGTINGLSLLNTIRAERSPLNLPVIIISGSSDSANIVTALRDGANDYVVKPFDTSTVRARVRTQITLKALKDVNDHFLRTASHDLKKPIMLMLDVASQIRLSAQNGEPMSADDQSALDLLIDTGKYMQQIIGELLDMGAIRAGRIHLQKQSTDFGAIVRQAVAHNSGYAHGKGIDLSLKFSPGLPHILADELRLLQVLDNLIGNAIKFSPAKTRIMISTSIDDERIVCEVADEGPGLSTQDQARLFQPYQSLSNKPTGNEQSTGLGLAICKELVALHNGEIGVRNNTGRGATFWIRIPIKPPLAHTTTLDEPGMAAGAT